MVKWKRCLCIVLAVAVLCLPALAEEVATGGEQQTAIDLQLPAAEAILMEASSGKILYESNATQQRSPASITKIMTLLLTMEALDSGKISLDDVVVCSETASAIGGAQIWLEPGEKFTVHELLKATAIASANDAATQLAEYVGGSVEAFVTMMNDRAKELGMENTTFINPTGLDAEGHLSCAKDVALMSRALIQHPLIFQYSTVWTDTLRNGASLLTNTNKLLKTYNGITGLKTGTTDKAGYCLSATANRDGLELIAVVMGSPTGEQRFAAAKQLLDYGYNNFSIYTPQIQDTFPKNLPVQGGIKDKMGLSYEEMKPIVVKKMSNAQYTYETQLPDMVTAPLEKGQSIGTVKVLCNGEQVGEFSIKSEESIDIMTFFAAMKKLFYALIGISW